MIATETPCITIHSPYNPETASLFDLQDSKLQDLDIVISGLSKPLHAHGNIIRSASRTIDSLFEGRPSPYCKMKEGRVYTVEWTHERTESDAAYRTILVKWLHLCYSVDQSFSMMECPTALNVLLQLDLKGPNGEEDIAATVETQMVEVAKNNALAGIQMVPKCLRELYLKEKELRKLYARLDNMECDTTDHDFEMQHDMKEKDDRTHNSFEFSDSFRKNKDNNQLGLF